MFLHLRGLACYDVVSPVNLPNIPHSLFRSWKLCPEHEKILIRCSLLQEHPAPGLFGLTDESRAPYLCASLSAFSGPDTSWLTSEVLRIPPCHFIMVGIFPSTTEVSLTGSARSDVLISHVDLAQPPRDIYQHYAIRGRFRLLVLPSNLFHTISPEVLESYFCGHDFQGAGLLDRNDIWICGYLQERSHAL